jgi:NarL family two-component system response regulator LiaR
VLQAGAIGYLMKDVSALALGEAIRAASRGRPTLAPEATKALMGHDRRSREPGAQLTDRERDILRLLVQGLTNPQIASHLSVSRSTVQTHVANLLGKLHATSRTQAVAMALKDRLLDD